MNICVLSYNHPNLTERCVNSILKHVDETNVSLVHNGSKPKNIRLLKKLFPKIKHHILHENQGFTAGANFGLTEIFLSHEWALFVSNDCELLVRPLKPNRPGFYSPLIYRRKTNKVDSIGGLFSPLTGRLRHIRNLSEAELSIKKKKFLRYFYVPGASFVIDKVSWQKIGGFDQSLHTYWEDVDLSARAHKKGVHFGLLPDLQLRHHIGRTCHKKSFYTKNLYWKNRARISRRHTPVALHPLQSLWL